MKTIVINKNSWHYRLLTWWGREHITANTNICQYSRTVLLGLVITALGAIILAAIAGFLLFSVADAVAWIVASVVLGGFADLSGPGPLLTILVTGIGVPCLLWVACTRTWQAHRDSIAQHLDIPVVSQAYRAWREKWCARVEVADD